MKSLLRVVTGSSGQVSVISDADKAASLLDENNKLISDFAKVQAELEQAKAKLKDNKKDLERAQRLKDDLIEESAAIGKKNRKEIKELKGNISDLEKQRESLKSDLASKSEEHRVTTIDLTTSSIKYNNLAKRFRRTRIACIALAVVILIIVAFNWQIVLAFCLKIVAFIVKTLAYFLSGWAPS